MSMMDIILDVIDGGPNSIAQNWNRWLTQDKAQAGTDVKHVSLTMYMEGVNR